MSLGLALVAAGLAAHPMVGAQAAPASTGGPVGRRPTEGRRLRVRGPAGQPGHRTRRLRPRQGPNGDLFPGVAAEGRQGAVDKADRLPRQVRRQLRRPRRRAGADRRLRRQGRLDGHLPQSYKGVPVFGGELKAHVDREGDLTSVNGFAAPDLSLDVTPARRPGATRPPSALDAGQGRPAGYEDGGPADFTQGLEVRNADLIVYRTGSPRGNDGEAMLAYAVEVWNKATRPRVADPRRHDRQAAQPLVDDGRRARPRALRGHAARRRTRPSRPRSGARATPFPGPLDQDQQNEVLGAGEAYWMFRNTFGYDS